MFKRLRKITPFLCWVGMAVMTSGSAWAIGAWERWEAPLNSSVSKTPVQAYNSVQVEATFWLRSGASCVEPTTCANSETCYKGFAFWDGDAVHPERFKIRGAFPAGTWCWKTCLLPRTGSVCASDSGLNQSGQVSVTPQSTTAGLYSNGFLKVSASKRHLTTWNGQTTFLWHGDTAWNAPISYASNRTLWKNYVTKRATGFDADSANTGGGGFTNILVAPAIQTLANPPAGGFRGFIAPPNCATGDRPVVPSACHYWDSAYWRDFEEMIKVANDQRIVIVVADVMDPLNRAGSNQMISPQVKFPARADAATFARQLASRLAGSFVVFSPSFDVRVNDPTAEPNVTVAGLIDAVGAAIRQAAPRHLIGVHLAGASPLRDYDSFQGKTWLSLQIFQSGSGSNGDCGSLPLANDYARWVCRARSFALRLRCVGEPASNAACTGSGAPTGVPAKPAVNVEGQYEELNNLLTRIQSRHIAWNTGLSGSFGYNIGLKPDISSWTNPASFSAANHYSDNDLGRMKGLFKTMPWTELRPRSDLLVEQNVFTPTQTQCTANGTSAPADWLQLWKPHLAIDANNTRALAYLPRPTKCALQGGAAFPTSTSIVLDRVKANALGISCATWTGTWVSPVSTDPLKGGFADVAATCLDSTNGPVKFLVPLNRITCGESCDRVLSLAIGRSSAGNSPNIAVSFTYDLRTSTEISDEGQTSGITGQLVLNGFSKGSPILLSGPDKLFRKLPSSALDAAGNFVVAWEEENSAGTDDIAVARFNSLLEPIGLPFLINDTTDGQQAEPWVSGDDSGNTVAVWTSYSEDDEIAGDIYGKVLDNSGQPLGPEFLISSDNQGNQSMPQVQMVGDGSFVVAWTQESSGDPTVETFEAVSGVEKSTGHGEKNGVYYRIFSRDGEPLGYERRVESGNRGQARLSRLEAHRDGSFEVRWHELDTNGQDQGEREQEHDRIGNPRGGH